jgi:hypothetical protein
MPRQRALAAFGGGPVRYSGQHGKATIALPAAVWWRATTRRFFSNNSPLGRNCLVTCGARSGTYRRQRCWRLLLALRWAFARGDRAVTRPAPPTAQRLGLRHPGTCSQADACHSSGRVAGDRSQASGAQASAPGQQPNFQPAFGPRTKALDFDTTTENPSASPPAARFRATVRDPRILKQAHHRPRTLAGAALRASLTRTRGLTRGRNGQASHGLTPVFISAPVRFSSQLPRCPGRAGRGAAARRRVPLQSWERPASAGSIRGSRQSPALVVAGGPLRPRWRQFPRSPTGC